MHRKSIDESVIRELAIEHNMPLEKYLAAFVIQEFMMLVSKSDYATRLLCMNPGILKEKTHSRTGNISLYYRYSLMPGESLDKSRFAYVLKDAVKYVGMTPVLFSWQTEIMEDRLCVNLMGTVGDMTVPFRVYVSSETEMVRPESLTIKDMVDEADEFELWIYPASSRLAADLSIIVRDLDFISDMSAYDRVYGILREFEFDARHFQRALFDTLDDMNIDLDEMRYEMIRSYATSAQMKKRWSSYAKKKKKADVTWQQVIELIFKAMDPVWNAHNSGEVYIADWMCELGKYI